MRACLIAVLMAVAGFPAAQAHSPTAPVKLETGLVIGLEHNGVEFFKGIPYAAPPVGSLRWRAPQPAAAWKGERLMEEFGKACPQKPRADELGFALRPEDMSEDCLTINVWRPEKMSAAKKLPVLVWIHGGGFTEGSSSKPIYDGTALAKGGLVFVSFNYRLGRLGIFAHPALTKENADGGRLANYGLMDQIAALQWVKRNIAAFGGDPDQVTIFGNSAGAASVDALMIAPDARGLFHKAISQSGYGRGDYQRVSATSPQGYRSGEADGLDLAAAIGLKDTDLAALRVAPADKIVAVPIMSETIFTFMLDGKTLTRDLWDAFRRGEEAPVPFVIGSNTHETPAGDAVAERQKRPLKGLDVSSLIAAYGGQAAYNDHIGSDISFTEQARSLANLHRKNGHPAYLYVFGAVTAEDAAAGKGAGHGTELRYVFETLRLGKKPIADPANVKIAQTMSHMWRAFAVSGNPSAPNIPWPAYDGVRVMHFTRDGAKVAPDPRNPRLDALHALLDPRS